MCRGCAEDPLLAARCRERRAELLRRIYLFEDLSAEHLDAVLGSMRETALPADHWLHLCHDAAESFYLMIEGEIALLRHSAEGDEFIVAIVGPGELFAEDLVVLDEARHTTSARTLGPCQVATFDRRRFRHLLEREPQLLHKLLHTLHRRNTILLDELERVTTRNASERLVAFLEAQAASDAAAPLRIPKRVLASKLSIRPETLSRVLGRLKECRRIQEVDGCILLTEAHDDLCAGCADCPARLWGCPGPRRAPLPATAEAVETMRR